MLIYGVIPKKSLGQNFLVNPRILDKIVAAAEISNNDTVLEIGPGTGNLTEKLAIKAGKVIAIEKDRRLIGELREKFRGTNAEIAEGDILKISTDNLRLTTNNYKLSTMIIGVHSKSAFKRERSRVDEYVYQLIKHFAMLDEATRHRFLLYTPFYHDTLYLPPNFIVRRFYTPFFWTKLFFSLKVWFDAPNVLFMPVNFLPLFSFRRTIAVIHGLEFEVYPEMFEAAHLNYLRKGTKRVARYATKIIVPTNTVMENLIKFYHVDQSRIVVIPYGVNPQIAYHHRYAPIDEQYILFVGKLEKRKNIIRYCHDGVYQS